MSVTEMIDRVKLLQDKFNYNDNLISKDLGITTKKLRELRLTNKVFYQETEVKNNDYLKLAIKFKELEEEVYFPVEFARLTNTSPYTANMICKMFNVKPSKKAYCQHCGKEVEVKTTAVPKFCNSICRYKYKGDAVC